MTAALDDVLAVRELRLSLPSPEECRSLRERAGVSTRTLAQTIGVSHSALVRWEGGQTRPRAGALRRYVAVIERLRAALEGTRSK